MLLAAVYFIPFFGGILADKFGYGKMVTMGIVVMFIGYALLAIPTSNDSGKVMMFGALALIACGTGLFKGNLQVMVGNLYDALNIAPNVTRRSVYSIWLSISVRCTLRQLLQR